MNNVTLRQLRYFEVLARHCHFGQAAAIAGISQPALSVQIRDLEAALGGALFERGPRQVRLTRFGHDVAARVRIILEQVEVLGDFARAASGQLNGRVRLGVIPTIAPYLLPTLLVRLNATHPEAELHIRESLTARLVEELLDGRLDCAIVALPVSESGLTEMALAQEPFMLVRPLAQADDPVPDPQDLMERRLLLLEEGHCFRDQALAFCNLRKSVSRDGLDGSSLATLVQMVGAGIGVTLVPAMAVPVETRSAAVSVVGFGRQEPSRTVGLIWRKASPLTAQFEELGGVVREAIGALPGI